MRLRIPWAFVFAAAGALALEAAVFSQAYLLADPTNLNWVVKKSELHGKKFGEEVIFMGDSLMVGLNAAQMEREAGGAYTVRNCAIGQMDHSLEYFLTLKQYLRHQPKPGLIVLGTRTAPFYKEKEEHPFDRVMIQRMRRYFDWDLVFEAAPRLSTLLGYVRNLLPSWNYRAFIVAVLPKPFCQYGDLRVDWFWMRPGRFAERLKSGRAQKEKIASTKGYFDVGGEYSLASPREMRDRMNAEREMAHRRPEVVYPGTVNLEKFFALAEENGIPVLYFVPPMNPYRWARARDERYFENMNRRLDEMENKYSGFTYFKVADVGYFPECFADPYHLNGRGTWMFSRAAIRSMDPIIRKKLKGEFAKGLPPRKSWRLDEP